MDGSTRRRSRHRRDSTADSRAGSSDEPGHQQQPIELRLAGTPPLRGVPEDDEAMTALRDACRLLDELKVERRNLEERLAIARRQDPLRVVTGQSSMDRACTELEELIRAMDELLTEQAERLLVAGVDASGR